MRAESLGRQMFLRAVGTIHFLDLLRLLYAALHTLHTLHSARHTLHTALVAAERRLIVVRLHHPCAYAATHRAAHHVHRHNPGKKPVAALPVSHLVDCVVHRAEHLLLLPRVSRDAHRRLRRQCLRNLAPFSRRRVDSYVVDIKFR